MHRIAVIPGDGIGREVVEEGKKVVEAACEAENVSLEWEKYPYGGEHYIKTGETLPQEGLEELEKSEAIFFGAVGDPRVRPGVLEQGILLKLRFHFDQYVNLRPVKLYPTIESPLKGRKSIDFFVVRENTEDFYAGIGARFRGKRSSEELEVLRKLYRLKFGVEVENEGSEEIAYQIGVVSREGSKRVMEYSFELAKSRGMKRVTSVDKANVLTHAYSLWREVFEEVASGYDMETEYTFVDAITMFFLTRPEHYQVVVTPQHVRGYYHRPGCPDSGGDRALPQREYKPPGGEHVRARPWLSP